MLALVSFDSSLGPLNAEGNPIGRTDYSGVLPRSPQRWRIEFEAMQPELNIVAGDELSPKLKLPLTNLVHGYVLPHLDYLIAHVREQVKLLTGCEHTEEMFVITAKFRVYRWR